MDLTKFFADFASDLFKILTPLRKCSFPNDGNYMARRETDKKYNLLFMNADDFSGIMLEVAITHKLVPSFRLVASASKHGVFYIIFLHNGIFQTKFVNL